MTPCLWDGNDCQRTAALYDALRAERDTLRRACEGATESLGALQARVTEVEAGNAKLHDQNTNLMSEVDELRAELNAAKLSTWGLRALSLKPGKFPESLEYLMDEVAKGEADLRAQLAAATKERDDFKKRLAHDTARWLECIKEQDEAEARASRLAAALEQMSPSLLRAASLPSYAASVEAALAEPATEARSYCSAHRQRVAWCTQCEAGEKR